MFGFSTSLCVYVPKQMEHTNAFKANLVPKRAENDKQKQQSG